MIRPKKLQTLVFATGAMSAIALSLATAALAQSRDLWLLNGEMATVEGYFNAGESIYGWCDEDCADLDIMMYDSDGNMVAQDVELDANPHVIAPYEGTFQLQVAMPNCTHPSGCAVWVDSDAGF